MSAPKRLTINHKAIYACRKIQQAYIVMLQYIKQLSADRLFCEELTDQTAQASDGESLRRAIDHIEVRSLFLG